LLDFVAQARNRQLIGLAAPTRVMLRHTALDFEAASARYNFGFNEWFFHPSFALIGMDGNWQRSLA